MANNVSIYEDVHDKLLLSDFDENVLQDLRSISWPDQDDWKVVFPFREIFPNPENLQILGNSEPNREIPSLRKLRIPGFGKSQSREN